jgi:hypothetical protein
MVETDCAARQLDGSVIVGRPGRSRARPGVTVSMSFGIGADIADMGKGEVDDLTGIGGVGHDLLIAGHRGVEADLAHRLARAPRPRPFRHRAVAKDRKGGGRGASGRSREERSWPMALGRKIVKLDLAGLGAPVQSPPGLGPRSATVFGDRRRSPVSKLRIPLRQANVLLFFAAKTADVFNRLVSLRQGLPKIASADRIL